MPGRPPTRVSCSVRRPPVSTSSSGSNPVASTWARPEPAGASRVLV